MNEKDDTQIQVNIFYNLPPYGSVAWHCWKSSMDQQQQIRQQNWWLKIECVTLWRIEGFFLQNTIDKHTIFMLNPIWLIFFSPVKLGICNTTKKWYACIEMVLGQCVGQERKVDIVVHIDYKIMHIFFGNSDGISIHINRNVYFSINIWFKWQLFFSLAFFPFFFSIKKMHSMVECGC